MKSKKSFVIMVPIAVYLFFLLGFSIIHKPFFVDSLLPFGSLLAGAVLFDSFWRSGPKKTGKWIWLIFSIACFIWAAADTLCAVYYFQGENPQGHFLYLLYPAANLWLAVGFIVLGCYRFRRWNGLQFILDCGSCTLCALYFLWLLFFGGKLTFLQVIAQNGLFSVFSVILDFIVVIGVSIWILSMRRSGIPRFIRIVSAGAALFAVNNLYYSYLYLNGKYTAGSLVDAVYVVALMMIAMGSDFEKNSEPDGPERKEDGTYAAAGLWIRSFFLFVYPLVTVLLKGLVLKNIVIYAMIIAVYMICTVYIQIALKDQQLLNQEKELNRILEEQVRQRTKELVEKNKILNSISNQDTVTKLYNRRYFDQALQEKMKRIKPPRNIALLFIDLDRFKTINDTYGHGVGDRILMEISRRLKAWDKENAVLARLGGDEFVLAFDGWFGYHQVEFLADEIIKSCSESIEIDGYIFHVTMSVGISIYPIDAKNCEALMKNADIAMYQAKSKGFNQYVSFDSPLDERSNRKNKIEMLLKRAVYDREFQLYYQPQVNVISGKVVGAEALLRWKTPEGEWIRPAEFIPIAEETDDIIPIGAWVTDQAIRQIKRWNTKYHSQIKIGINVSPKQLDNKNFMEALKGEIRDNGICSKWLDVEITENIAMEGKQRITEVFTLFNEMGISISIDDFGTGYSSLSYLKYFPFDRIKISKPMIDAISEHNYDLQIVKAIILLAKSIGIRTIAEGVENQKQFDILKKLECEEVQGYLFSEPLPAEEFEKRFLSADGRESPCSTVGGSGFTADR